VAQCQSFCIFLVFYDITPYSGYIIRGTFFWLSSQGASPPPPLTFPILSYLCFIPSRPFVPCLSLLSCHLHSSSPPPPTSVINSHTSCCHSPVFPRPVIFMFHPSHLYSSFRLQTSVINSHTSCCHYSVFPRPLILILYPFSSLRPLPLSPFLSSVLVLSSPNLCNHTSCSHPY
jgi:hypothetical protein